MYKLIQRASALAITQTQAKKMFKAGQRPVIADISKDRADALKLEFEGLGAKVELRPHAS